MGYQQVRLANDTKTYEKLGIDPDKISLSEDGFRTDGTKGTYEWWYTDTEFDDGTVVVVIFYSKNRFDTAGKAWPRVDIDITHPDGTKTLLSSQEKKGTVINASRNKCDVTINKSYLKNEDGKYHLHFEEGDITYDAIMTSLLPMWRPDSGHWMFGDNDENYFAWFVAQPSAAVEATLTLGNKTAKLKGTGYHDHNWGNIEMNKLMNHWYWGRAKVGEYTLIACDIIAEEKYGNKRLPVFMLAKDGKILTDDQSKTQISRHDTMEHPISKKFIDNHLIYYQPLTTNESYTVEFIREKDIFMDSLLDSISPLESFIAKIIKANPTYARVMGSVKVTHELGGEKTIDVAEGLWEQMFFGSNKEAKIEN